MTGLLAEIWSDMRGVLFWSGILLLVIVVCLLLFGLLDVLTGGSLL